MAAAVVVGRWCGFVKLEEERERVCLYWSSTLGNVLNHAHHPRLTSRTGDQTEERRGAWKIMALESHGSDFTPSCCVEFLRWPPISF